MGVKRDVNAIIGNSLLQQVNEIMGTTKQTKKHQQHCVIADPNAIHWLSALAFQRALQRGSYKRLNCDTDRNVDRDADRDVNTAHINIFNIFLLFFRPFSLLCLIPNELSLLI